MFRSGVSQLRRRINSKHLLIQHMFLQELMPKFSAIIAVTSCPCGWTWYLNCTGTTISMINPCDIISFMMIWIIVIYMKVAAIYSDISSKSSISYDFCFSTFRHCTSPLSNQTGRRWGDHYFPRHKDHAANKSSEYHHERCAHGNSNNR